MKTLLLVLVMAGSALGAGTDAGNVLQNSDFSDGLSHWHGDCRPLSVALDAAAPDKGAAVEIRSTWQKMTQPFDAKKGTYVVSVTFTLTPGTTFATEEPEYRKIPMKLGFSSLQNFRIKPGDWCIIVTDFEASRYVHCTVKPLTGNSSVQTVTGEITLDSDCRQDAFCLAFPPGHGVVTIQNVTLTPKG